MEKESKEGDSGAQTGERGLLHLLTAKHQPRTRSLRLPLKNIYVRFTAFIMLLYHSFHLRAKIG